MSEAAENGPLPIEYGQAEFALEAGESGDLAVVVPWSDGALVAAIDGLGHGPEAALAAREAGRTLEQNSREAVGDLIARCHAAIRRTRGVVMSLARFDTFGSGTMTWVGVGNVEATLIRAERLGQRPTETLSCRGGVVGYQLPLLRPTTLPVSPGDTLILTTDGIHRDFMARAPVWETPGLIAESILDAYATRADDALVLVVRYLGRTAP